MSSDALPNVINMFYNVNSKTKPNKAPSTRCAFLLCKQIWLIFNLDVTCKWKFLGVYFAYMTQGHDDNFPVTGNYYM